jgi:hypothetical protein
MPQPGQRAAAPGRQTRAQARGSFAGAAYGDQRFGGRNRIAFKQVHLSTLAEARFAGFRRAFLYPIFPPLPLVHMVGSSSRPHSTITAKAVDKRELARL